MTRLTVLLLVALALSGGAHAQQINTPITPPIAPSVGQVERLPRDVLSQRAPNNFTGTQRISVDAPLASALRVQKVLGALESGEPGGARAAWRLNMNHALSQVPEPGELTLALRVTAGWRYRLVCEFDGDTPALTSRDLPDERDFGPGSGTGRAASGHLTAEILPPELRPESVRYTWARSAGVSRLTATLESVPRDVWRELRFSNASATRVISTTFYACEVSALS